MDGAAPIIEGTEKLIDDIAEWLMAQALHDVAIDELIDGTCKRLRAAGLPLERMALAFQTLHPLYRGVFYVWTEKDGPVRRLLDHESFRSGSSWEDSPFKV